MAKKQYIGDRIVKSINDNVVVFKDGDSKTFTAKQLEYIVTDKELDATAFEEMILIAIVKDMLKAMKSSDLESTHESTKSLLQVYEDHDIKMSQVDKVNQIMLSMIKNIIQNTADNYMIWYKEAIGKVFGTYKEWLHYDFFVEDIKVSDIKRVKEQ